jgi:hypothetical protein
VLSNQALHIDEEKSMPAYGTREYTNIGKTRIDMMIAEAISQGAIITGSNPWDIDTRLHGAVLRVRWDKHKMTLAISVVNINWYVPRETVWETIDTLLDGFMRQTKEMEGAFGHEIDAG